jgi:hypothetical protein
MHHQRSTPVRRRDFLASMAAGVTALTASPRRAIAAPSEGRLLAGEGVVDITPPLGIEMGGFHRPPGKERRIQGIRQPCAARALVLELDGVRVAICSLDVAGVGQDMAARIRSEAARQAGIPAENVHVCATHTHSMPCFCYTRQWGAVPADFMAVVEKKTIEAVRRAAADLAPAEVALGKCRVKGGNHNRTTKVYKTDEQFTKDSNDGERWLDTMLHALLFHRPGGKRTLAWYHFSAHAVCFADEIAGPDWPGRVAELVRQSEKLEPSFLQGHVGDVNPGDGSDWRGEIKQTVAAIYPALRDAVRAATPVKIDTLKTARRDFLLPLDIALFQEWLARYQKDPAKCVGSEWVDAGFAADWYRGNRSRKPSETHLPITISAVRLGPIGMLFHPAELYSSYGLTIRRDSPFADTLVVGYTDGIIGYLPDPNAYKAREYAAIVVPKILDYPPFTPTAARQFTAAGLELLETLH